MAPRFSPANVTVGAAHLTSNPSRWRLAAGPRAPSSSPNASRLVAPDSGNRLHNQTRTTSPLGTTTDRAGSSSAPASANAPFPGAVTPCQIKGNRHGRRAWLSRFQPIGPRHARRKKAGRIDNTPCTETVLYERVAQESPRRRNASLESQRCSFPNRSPLTPPNGPQLSSSKTRWHESVGDRRASVADGVYPVLPAIMPSKDPSERCLRNDF